MNKKASILARQIFYLSIIIVLFSITPSSIKIVEQDVFASTIYREKEINQYGTITYERFRVLKSLENPTPVEDEEVVRLNQTFFIKKSYSKGIETFYRLESNQGEELGYINASSVTLTKDKSEGFMQSLVGTKTVNQSDISIFSDFLWGIKGTTNDFIGEEVRVKGAYHHFNGKTYYDVYDKSNKQIGLFPEEAFAETQITNENLESSEEVLASIDQVADVMSSFKEEKQLDTQAEKPRVQESLQEPQLPAIPPITYLLGGQSKSARVQRIGENEFGNNTRSFSAATYTNKSDFVEKIAKDAQEVANKYGLYPSVMIAQAILESAYGESQLTKEANNFFGIKFTIGKDEGRFGRYDIHSDEFINGERVSLAASFRKYPTAKDSLEDNGQLLANGLSWDPTFYQTSWRENAKTYREATKGLTGKYATDPLYDTKLNQLIENWNLSQYD